MSDQTVAVVSLAEVKAHLNYADGDTADDAELGRFAVAATEVAEEIAGSIISRTLTEQHNGGGCTIVLRQPAASVTSIVEYLAQTAYPLTAEPLGGAGYSFYGFTVDGPVVTRRSFGIPTPFMAGERNVIVTYTAGSADVPEKIKLGVLELVRHWWQWGQQQSSGNQLARGGYSDEAVQSLAKMGYALPNRVVQLLSPDRRIPGIG